MQLAVNRCYLKTSAGINWVDDSTHALHFWMQPMAYITCAVGFSIFKTQNDVVELLSSFCSRILETDIRLLPTI